ncbi:DUF2147 domain-containing protein [Rhodobacteraceae bacterium RKSG542]|uniref:DUF2147 domain-containing protein n=1 Tax=Pseudovibrio flavus TaxID=2529854 RepID=UPI0012BD6640|nr:DUF2147 domain-containing protein [Pseudovibrio flavus]MTI16342.1 DUF2147 domain-containing protein [Pseudovibrio flavus]
MAKRQILGGLIAAGLLASGGEAAASIEGRWITDDKATVQIKPCNDGLCAELLDFPPPNGEIMEQVTDRNNEDESKRNRKVLGINVLWGLKPVSTDKWAGMVYDPKRGMAVPATLKLQTNGKLTLTGCKKVVVNICKSEDWIRAQ